ncbi:transporter substrate-binding domain-containing protein [Hoeflea prorocentri]|uniref:Transporter substrate-binding domain-containing protein n=1 Tax=Hoeflea prorocentri TaxID=1922333 RepID=A0A9X3ZG42_9HYPH|nr:transporter substrate-binding domain-containing protein [Hoeflea prorocentri]MCY6379364.1 transporter substrate-binding domain-containing protein [Hoeflea prorocentri]MDA5397165.1 transporter substrate-binding domain-containing protein [Hoeflea prorocentri]
MKLRKTILAIAAIACVSITGAVSAEDRPTSITIATEGAYPPWNYTEADGTLVGYEIELIDEICGRLKVECEVVAQDWNGIIPGLTAGKYDAIIASMGATDERRKVVDFSDPYARAPNGFLVSSSGSLADLPFAGQTFNLGGDTSELEGALAELKPFVQGKTLGVQGGSTAANFANEVLKGIVEIKEYGTVDQHNLDLTAGRIDLVVGNVTSLAAAAEDIGDTVKIAGPSFTGGVLGAGTTHVAVRKSEPALLEMMNEAVASIIADGTNSKLTKKWFGVDIGNPN